MGYFASRSAAMGPVPADVVVATFYNFNPDLVRGCIPDAWERSSPADILGARLDAVDAALRRLVPDAIGSADVDEAAALARRATEACTPQGRPLYAAHAELPWPSDAHLVLWHAITLLREYRGDGHIAVLVAEGIGPVEALVMHAASGEVNRDILQATRAWSDDDWVAAEQRLRERGWLRDDGSFTSEGETARQRVEDRTDTLASPPWDRLGIEDGDRLRTLVRPLSQAISRSVF